MFVSVVVAVVVRSFSCLLLLEDSNAAAGFWDAQSNTHIIVVLHHTIGTFNYTNL